MTANLTVFQLSYQNGTQSPENSSLLGYGLCPASVDTYSMVLVLVIAVITVFCIGFSCRKAPRNFMRMQLSQGTSELGRVFFTRRPLALDLAFLFFLAIWIFYAFREFRFIEQCPRFLEGLVMFVAVDVGVFAHICVQLKRTRPRFPMWDRLKTHFKNTLSYTTYSLFVGFPIGSATKLLFILWQLNKVGSWIILLPYLLTLGISCILTTAMTFYVILHRYQNSDPITRQWTLTLFGLTCVAVFMAVWFYGFITMEAFLSEPFDAMNVCWTLRLLPVLFIPVVAIVATFIYPMYKGKGEIVWFQPEIVFFLCLVGVALPILSWFREDQSRVQTVWYSMVPLFLCCIHQMMFFALCMANPLFGGPLPATVEVAPPRISLTVRRKELRNALRGTNVMKLGTNWIMRRRQVIQNVAIMPKPPNIDGEKCSICLEPFNLDPEEVNIGYLHKCGHIFHFDCVWRWIDEKLKCPLCREGVKITQDDMSLLSLSELRDLFYTRQRTTSDAKSLRSVRSSATCHTTVCFMPEGVVSEDPEPSPSIAADTSYDYEDMDREITRIFSVVLPDTYPENLSDADGFPYVPGACTLCMEHYEDDDVEVGYIMPCMHFFHVHCIAGWINQYNVCPHCPLGRRLLDDDDIYVMSLRNMLVSLEEVKPWAIY